MEPMRHRAGLVGLALLAGCGGPPAEIVATETYAAAEMMSFCRGQIAATRRAAADAVVVEGVVQDRSGFRVPVLLPGGGRTVCRFAPDGTWLGLGAA